MIGTIRRLREVATRLASVCSSRPLRHRLVPLVCAAAAAGALAPGGEAWGATYYYVNWTSANVAGGTATGIITLPDASTVTVTFQALNPDNSPGNLFGAQTSGGGTNYWVPSTPYISSQVQNPPPDSDILQLAGGQNQRYVVTLSAPIRDPIMAIVSLGASGTPTTYDFDVPFTIVSQGVGFFGGGPNALSTLPGDILRGAEGHGTIQFVGTFSTFSWTVPTPEVWHGFTFGIRTTEQLEPSLSINSVTAAEGNAGVTPFVFAVTLSVASTQTVTVDYATASGTATSGSDFTAASGTLTFAPGVTSQTITVNVLGDTTAEPNETFLVNLSNPVNAAIVVTQGTGTINNDDASAPVAAAQIPTLAEWSLLATGALILMAGLAALRRRSGR